MKPQKQHIEDIFKEALENHEVQPPASIWETVEASLDNAKNVEAVYASAFKNARIAPAANLWKRISRALFWRSFFSFNTQSFNIYYVGVVLSACGIALYSLFPPKAMPETHSVAAITQVALNTAETPVANTQQEQTQQAAKPQQTQLNAAATQAVASHKQEQRITSQTYNSGKSTENEVLSPAKKEPTQGNFDFTQVHIVGSSAICADSPAEYEIEGLPSNAVIDWKLPQGARSTFISTRKIAALFSKAGSFVVVAKVKVGSETEKIELPVRVEEAPKPEIKGSRSVCEGSEQELYSVNEPVNKEITYHWELRRNTIMPTDNKYVNVDWNIAGKDTLTVTRINRITGCSSASSIPILIKAKPKVDFTMAAITTNEYEFWFVGESKKIQSFNWTIDGSQYSTETVTYTNYGANNSLVKLEVTDKAGCKNTVQKEAMFGRNILFVPKTFELSNRNGFIPQTNTRLQSYTIEIYNSKSEKIWSSNELVDGKPAKAWNGMLRNEPVSKGKYMWRIEAVFDDGTLWHGVRQTDGKMQTTGIFMVEP
jgi:hypothetical protein